MTKPYYEQDGVTIYHGAPADEDRTMKYRKKPIVVEAVQWFPDARIYHPGVYCDLEGEGRDRPYVVTIHNQRVYIAPGDWILPELDGKSYYPCKADVFAATYEAVDG